MNIGARDSIQNLSLISTCCASSSLKSKLNIIKTNVANSPKAKQCAIICK